MLTVLKLLQDQRSTRGVCGNKRAISVLQTRIARFILAAKQKHLLTVFLSEPFTLYTSFASALGSSAKRRVYGFIDIADKGDLASLLVKNGYARAHGVCIKTPDGTHRDEMMERLHDLEASAMLKRVGVWSKSDPDRIPETRAKQRSDDQELADFIKPKSSSGILAPMDLNTASKAELGYIKGIGPVYADRIIAGRPYKTVDELIKVNGIGSKTLEQIRPYVVVDKKIANGNE